MKLRQGLSSHHHWALRRFRHDRKLDLESLEPRLNLSSSAVLSSAMTTTSPPSSVASGEVASLDGSGNNLGNPDWGSAGLDLLRAATPDYGDGVASPAGTDRPGAREVSNAVAAHPEGDLKNSRNLTALIYAWGQFIDHDIDLTPTASPRIALNIPVPIGDPQFDPNSTGGVVIPFGRAASDPSTGTDTGQPLAHPNNISAFIDGSHIYGSDPARAAELRTFVGGLLKTSSGDLLPFNTTGLPNDNDTHQTPDDLLFLAGDPRANENIELTALHTLFVREHNRIAAALATSNPALTDEQIYQQARRLVIAELQAITFNEFLPTLLGQSAPRPYSGYNASVNPSITAEFSTAAFRIGHTLVGNDVEFLDNNGNEIREPLPLSEAFFNPGVLSETGIDPILKYLAVDLAEEVDTKVVDSLRNLLFGAPGAGGLDLAAINIQRGRDLGLADYNTTRVAYGLPAVASFSQITSDPVLAQTLQELFGDVDHIDLWVGGLAEDHLPGSSVGETFSRILTDQFSRIRDGDRFWYEAVFQGAALNDLWNTTLADVIERNTTLSQLQANVFFDESVVYVKTPEGRVSSELQLSIEGDHLRVVDERTGQLLVDRLVSDVGQVIVVGANSARDRLTLNMSLATAVPAGGVKVFGGSDSANQLVVLGSAGSDRISVDPGRVSVNNISAGFGGFQRLEVKAGAGDDAVNVVGNTGVAVVVHGGSGSDTVTGAVDSDIDKVRQGRARGRQGQAAGDRRGRDAAAIVSPAQRSSRGVNRRSLAASNSLNQATAQSPVTTRSITSLSRSGFRRAR